MERFVKLLPSRNMPWALQITAATGAMAFAALLHAFAATYVHRPVPFILLIGVFCCAVTINRGTGLYAAVLAAGYAWFSIFEKDPAGVTGFLVFCVMGIAVAAIGEAIRAVLKKALRAERQSAMFLLELQHRTQNTLTMIVSLLELQAAAAGNPEVREALKTSASRVRLQSDAHRHLTLRNSSQIDAQEYLKEVCGLLQRTLQGIRPVEIRCSAQPTLVDPQKALAIGLMTNELVTNAVKYAFDDRAEGRITVELERDGSGRLRLSVSDNGHGCPETVKVGMGTSLVAALAKEYRGTFERVNRTHGCEAIVTLLPKPQAPPL